MKADKKTIMTNIDTRKITNDIMTMLKVIKKEALKKQWTLKKYYKQLDRMQHPSYRYVQAKARARLQAQVKHDIQDIHTNYTVGGKWAKVEQVVEDNTLTRTLTPTNKKFGDVGDNLPPIFADNASTMMNPITQSFMKQLAGILIQDITKKEMKEALATARKNITWRKSVQKSARVIPVAVPVKVLDAIDTMIDLKIKGMKDHRLHEGRLVTCEKIDHNDEGATIRVYKISDKKWK